MAFFETFLLLVLGAIGLLQVAKRTALPYPALLALAGIAVAFLPGAPAFAIDPRLALALFIAPALADAAYDFPLAQARALWRPVLVLAAGAVVTTALAVAWVGTAIAGLPLAAALALGAIVAPPDAAAAVAILGTVAMPRRTVGVLKGESLFNDASALLLYTGALAVMLPGEVSAAHLARLALAAPLGAAFGFVCGRIVKAAARHLQNTQGGAIFQFLAIFLTWIAAERLHISAVLAVVVLAMTVAHRSDLSNTPRMRVHSYALWSTTVFLLNVVAFMLMGMQARMIVADLSAADLERAGLVCLAVLAAIVAVRFAVVMAWRAGAVRSALLRGPMPRPTAGQGVVVAWCGMRGMVTLATAFALPAGFPQRDLVVLVAFSVVVATIVVQGATLAPLIRWLGVDRIEDPASDAATARTRLARIALDAIGPGDEAATLTPRSLHELALACPSDPAARARLLRYRRQGRAIIAHQRVAICAMRDRQDIDIEGFYALQEELDWRELALQPLEDRTIEEG